MVETPPFDENSAEIPERGFEFLGYEVRRRQSFSREEVETALKQYFALANQGASTGSWDPWSDLFTEDAIYVEHNFGIFRGREAIRRWVKASTGSRPIDLRVDDGWHLIDNDLCAVYAPNWRPAPDGGQRYNFNAVAILCYAGNDLWCYEEDVYNSNEGARVAKALAAAKASAKA